LIVKKRGGDEFLNRKEKELFITNMKDRLSKAQATFLVDYQGLDVDSINKVRGELRNTGAEFSVVKNRLLKLASKDTETALLEDYFLGPCAIAITYDDVVAPAKVLVDLCKDLDKLELKAGQTSGKLMNPDAIKRLAGLPGREQLLAQVLSVMQAVPTSFVRVTNGVLVNFMNVLKAIEKNKTDQPAQVTN
jgi:large subunit ribosomal protein L10